MQRPNVLKGVLKSVLDENALYSADRDHRSNIREVLKSVIASITAPFYERILSY